MFGLSNCQGSWMNEGTFPLLRKISIYPLRYKGLIGYMMCLEESREELTLTGN